jgi:LPXTG-motif cell wall-anchored protein
VEATGAEVSGVVVDTVGLAGDAGDTDSPYNPDGDIKVTFKLLKEHTLYENIDGGYYKVITKLPALKNEDGKTLDDDEIVSITIYNGNINGEGEYTLENISDLDNLLITSSQVENIKIVFNTKYEKSYSTYLNMDYTGLVETVTDVEASEKALSELPDIKITVSGIKESATKAFDVTFKSNVALRSFSVADTNFDTSKGKKFKYTVSKNGTYFYQAISSNGSVYNGEFEITAFKSASESLELGDMTPILASYETVSNQTSSSVDTLAQTGINGVWLYVVIFLGVASIGFIVVRKKVGGKK